ncbi:glutathione S-transferase family protein [Myxococcota bacterium]|nr:glutathione S-transferase family protein [Myxococcota bacterium]
MKIWGTRTQGSPRRLAVYLEEKGLSIPFLPVDLYRGEHRTPAFLARNPLALVPVLELDDGRHLSETLSIARYLEALHPDPPFLGRDPFERAHLDMWSRRIELGVYAEIRDWFRQTSPFARTLEPEQFPAWGEHQRKRAEAGLRLLERELETRPFLAGDAFSFADITLATSLEGTAKAGFAIPDDCPRLKIWLETCLARPSLITTRPAR